MTPATLINWLRGKLGLKLRFKVTIIYASGAKVSFRVTDFRFRRGFGGAKEFTWVSSSNRRPILLGPSDVVAVYQRETIF